MHAPAAIVDVELTAPVPALCGADHARFRSALVVVRLHSRPLGVLDLALAQGGLTEGELARAIWDSLGGRIRAHLLADGVEPPDALGVEGLAPMAAPSCLAARAAAIDAAVPVTVVIATRERPELLVACLDSFERIAYAPFSIVVVDNAPATAATREAVARLVERGRDIEYVVEARPGLARAHNAGLERVRTPLVALTDDDVIVDRFWLAELTAGFAGAPDVGCVTGSILPAELETDAQVWIERHAGFTKGYDRVVFDAETCRRDPLLPYAAGRFGSGANMAFRTDVLHEIGGFDPHMGAGTRSRGGDDLCAFFDVVAAGHTLVYEPAALVWHAHRAELDGLTRQMHGYGVGLGAYLTRTVVRRPGHALVMAARALRGAAHYRGSRAGGDLASQPEASLTRELVRAERRGVVSGPVAYASERLASRRQERSAA